MTTLGAVLLGWCVGAGLWLALTVRDMPDVSPGEARRPAADVQARAMQELPCIPLGQFL